MSNLDKFRKTLSPASFNTLTPTTQLVFYVSAIYCLNNNVGNKQLCQRVLGMYKKLLLRGGITGRNELCKPVGINPNHHIDSEVKGLIKARRILGEIGEKKVIPGKVYYCDDTKEIVDIVSKKTGVHSFWTTPLSPVFLMNLLIKKRQNTDSVKMLLLDFDGTLAMTKMKKKYLEYSDENIIDRVFGGQKRVNSILYYLQLLEQQGVIIGIISCQTSEVISDTLKKIGLT